MEHGNLDHHAVRRGKAHAVTDTFSVVDDVVVCEHNALGEACRARGVLHIAYVARTDSRRHSCHLLGADELISCHRLIEGQASGLLEADRNDVAQEGQSFCVERLARNGILDLGAELVDDLLIV